MNIVDRTAHRIDDIRCPAAQGPLPEDVDMLHKSWVEIVHLRSSIESTRLQIGRSWSAAYDSIELLRRLRSKGF